MQLKNSMEQINKKPRLRSNSKNSSHQTKEATSTYWSVEKKPKGAEKDRKQDWGSNKRKQNQEQLLSSKTYNRTKYPVFDGILWRQVFLCSEIEPSGFLFNLKTHSLPITLWCGDGGTSVHVPLRIRAINSSVSPVAIWQTLLPGIHMLVQLD